MRISSVSVSKARGRGRAPLDRASGRSRWSENDTSRADFARMSPDETSRTSGSCARTISIYQRRSDHAHLLSVVDRNRDCDIRTELRPRPRSEYPLHTNFRILLRFSTIVAKRDEERSRSMCVRTIKLNKKKKKKKKNIIL